MAKRKALKKYEYIKESDDLSFYFTYKSSSLPRVVTNYLPGFLLFLIVKIEIIIWRRLNKIPRSIVIKKEIDSNSFIFLYKKEHLLKELSFRSDYSIYCHLSHYHLYDVACEAYNSENVFLCYDNDVSGHSYFNKKFPLYNKKLIVVSFFVKDRFFSSNISLEEMRSKIAITGTFHSYKKSSGDFGIYCDDICTLHPIRYMLYKMDLKDPLRKILSMRLSRYTPKKSLIDLILNFREYRQKDYFEFDIVKFYSGHKFSIVAGEGTGAIAIGALEALASGSIPFLTPHESKGLDLPFDSYIQYDGSYDDLKEKIEECFSSEDFKDPNYYRSVAKQFDYKHCLKKFKARIT
ncbi:hypothetical protein EOPP23_15135 [Endozoicomonas sp. OPT23]|nr:hypothetical protein [Endozoicomonas sp. OPT23]